jgi:hypothetical protein
MSGFVRTTLGDARRGVSLFARVWVCFALAVLLAPAGGTVVSAAPKDGSIGTLNSVDVWSESLPSDRPLFELGNAARPFGWSTVIGDFNDDGKPDLVIADRLGERADVGGYAYRLELSISGQAPDDLTFESPDAALTIRASDIDHDHDLDIIVERPLSGDVVKVWLNNGHGHFSSGDARQFSATSQPSQTLDAVDPVVDLGALEWSPRRAHISVPGECRAGPSDSGACLAIASGHPLYCPPSLLRSRPRAPPSHS